MGWPGGQGVASSGGAAIEREGRVTLSGHGAGAPRLNRIRIDPERLT
jgi:hypothetical protein